MTKPVTLSDRAFALLRQEKKSGESDSEVVTRLIEYKIRHENDLDAFVGHKSIEDPNQARREIAADREYERNR